MIGHGICGIKAAYILWWEHCNDALSIVMMRSAFFYNKLKVLLCYLSNYVF
jgi:hypothetical protein